MNININVHITVQPATETVHTPMLLTLISLLQTSTLQHSKLSIWKSQPSYRHKNSKPYTQLLTLATQLNNRSNNN
jgi:hypothetical protein